MEPVLTQPGAPARDGRDVEVVRRARDGNQEAFTFLVRGRIDRLHRTAMAILGSEADAGDAVQDAFIAAWRELPRLRDPLAFDGWLLRIVVNECRMRLRARGRVREIPAADADATAAVPRGSVRPRPLDDALAANDRLERAFSRLSVDRRTVLVLYHLHDLSVGEIAAAIGRPAGTVKWRLSDARSALRRELEIENR